VAATVQNRPPTGMQADDWELPIVEAGACPWPQFGGKGISTAISQPPAPKQPAMAKGISRMRNALGYESVPTFVNGGRIWRP
jgi:hypothetical protein